MEAGKSVLLTELRKLASRSVDVGTVAVTAGSRTPPTPIVAPRTFRRINSLVRIAPATWRTSDVAAVGFRICPGEHQRLS